MTCSIEGCPRPVRARGWCDAHWKRWRRHGDPLGGRVNDPDSYEAVHRRIVRALGAASLHQCSACPSPAQVWAWQRTGPSRSGENAHGVRVSWGVDPEDYAPMCLSHASMLDGGGTLTHCPRGHLRSAAGTRPGGRCRECHREDGRSKPRLDITSSAG